MMAAGKEKRDYRQELTDMIIKKLEEGTAPWQKPWVPGESGEFPHNAITNKPYRGINALNLTLVADSKGYNDPRWMTYNQAADKGYQVRKGERGTLIEYWKFYEEKNVLDEKGKPVIDEETGKPKKERFKLNPPRPFRAVVFNAQQIDNVPEWKNEPKTFDWNPSERAEQIIRESGAKVFHDQADRAFYSPAKDEVHLPGRDQFPSDEAYYGTALHELGHWTGHSSRLNRDLLNRFGSEGYAREELRAELSSLFMAERLGVPHDPGQHAAYVGSWIKALKEDKNEIFRASRDAEMITEFLMSPELAKNVELAREKAMQESVVETSLQPGVNAGELRQNDMPAMGDSGYRTYVREMGKDQERTGDYQQIEATVKQLLGSDARLSVSSQDDTRSLQGKVIADSQYTFTLQTDEKEAVVLNKIDFRQLPAIGQEVAIGAMDTDNPANGRAIQIAQPDRQVQQGEKTYLDVPFAEKGEAKALGAKWEGGDVKKWYVPEGLDAEPFKKWMPAPAQEQAQAPVQDKSPVQDKAPAMEKSADGRVPLDVPFTEKGEAKALGAKWDAGNKSWYAPAGADLEKLHKWMPAPAQEQAQASIQDKSPIPEKTAVPDNVRVPLYVPFTEKGEAKALGAKWDVGSKSWYAPAGADLDKLQKWMQKPQQQVDVDPVTAFKEAAREAGLIIEGQPVIGKLTRVSVVDAEKGNKDGAYTFHLDGRPSGFIQNYRTDYRENWTHQGQQLSSEDRQKIAEHAKEVLAQRAEELQQQHSRVAEWAEKKWATLPLSPPDGQENGYLQRKQVEAFGVRFNGENMVVPLRDIDGKMWSMQNIEPGEGGNKHLTKNGRKEGTMHVIGNLEPGKDILIAEGYATAASLHMATGKPVIMAVDSGNLDAVVGQVKGRYPTSPIYIMGDDDRFNPKKNVGASKAMEAAKKHQVGWALPKFQAEGKLVDFNDLHVKEGLETVKHQVEEVISQTLMDSKKLIKDSVKVELLNGGVSDIVEKMPGENTRHTGPFVEVGSYHAVQSTAKNEVVVHEIAKLDKKPEVGKDVTAQYREGRAQIQDRQQDRQRQTGREIAA